MRTPTARWGPLGGVVLLLALGAPFSLVAQAGGRPVAVTIAPAESTVGDRVTVTLSVDSPAGEPQFPDPGKQWGDVTVVEAAPPTHTAGSTWQRRIVVAAFRTGEIELPSVTVRLPGGGEAKPAAPIRLQVRSLLPAEPAKVEPKPAAAPVELPREMRFWWLLALLAGLTLAAGGWLVELERRRRAAGRPTRQIPPLEELLHALGELGPTTPPEPGHAVLSLALRRYLGRSFGFHAAESTTSEIQRELGSRRIATATVKRTVQLLRDCDGVKFARRPARAEDLAARLATARELAETIEGQLQPPAEAVATSTSRGAAA